MNRGILYICPTPIGNLEDITLRTIRILKEVDLIAAEDTRHTIKLLNHYDIKKPLISYHEHNKKSKGELLIEKLKSGENIALVTDAGMPGISDPGEDLIRLSIEEGIEVIVLPGPTASIAALVISGLPTDKFVFEGFLPSKKRDRIKELERLKSETRTIILYEAPHRLLTLLKDMEKVLGNRQISISRELTKLHEETFRGYLSEGIEKFETQKPKGEFVLIVKGAEIKEEDLFEGINIKEHIKLYMEEGLSKRDAVKKVAEDRGISRNLVYKESINIE
ncbi:Ribosomal RNA small subunit methyltransferase I [[Clostridium] ultunense Esp]|uniref:16S rRNA (cytidine(1402)-2'-O)-methyltransferase n=1 Tax=Schnuerera ultunensis TaxID=45497 RepID=UPI0002B6FA7B|nr:16S rRNA (cytidine(1402)-2'-O)-methyltransferase [Schnuerera ultunensis]CCQ93241.1 Ribosomal RNA small subunit methyltransferase I [[Clostridium] ultunense Esp]